MWTMKWFKPDLEPPVSEEDKKKEHYRLTISLSNGAIYAWTNPKWDRLCKDFYKWYFWRTQSENFMVRYSSGERLIKRSMVVTFSVEKFVPEETPPEK
jgi:hypothetical protein